MNSSQSICRLCPTLRPHLTARTTPLSLYRLSPQRHALIATRSLFDGLFGRKKAKSGDQLVPTVTPAEESLQAKTLTDEEVMEMRDKSNLPTLVRARLRGENIPEIKLLRQLKTPAVRKRYATFGRASGLKPGVMWPSKDELQWLKGYERVFCKPLHEMVGEVKERREEEVRVKSDREREVLQNVKKLPKIKAEFWAKHNQMYREKEDEKHKKEKLVQEVREFVGYDLDPNDPRFEEALIKRDEELKRVLKAQRKQERHKLTLERLQTLANEAMERERQDKDILEKSKSTKDDNKASNN